MKKGLTLLVLASAFATSAFAKEGDVSRQRRQQVIGTSIVNVGRCVVSPAPNMNGGFYAVASIQFSKCQEIETYDVEVTENGTWESDTVVRIAGSERRGFALVSDSQSFADMNSAINNGHDTYIDPDLNGDGRVTKGERRRTRDIRDDQAIIDGLGDAARTAVGALHVQAQCENFAERLRMETVVYNNVPSECRR